jgi:hypothetical protein
VATLLVFVPGDSDVVAVGREADRGRPADARVGARDDGDRHGMGNALRVDA